MPGLRRFEARDGGLRGPDPFRNLGLGQSRLGPGFQNFVETIIDFVSGQVRDTFPGHNPLIAPLALTIFL